MVWVPDVLVCQSWRGSYCWEGGKLMGVSVVLVCLMRETAKPSLSVDRTEGILVGVALFLQAQLTEPELCARRRRERKCQAKSIFN